MAAASGLAEQLVAALGRRRGTGEIEAAAAVPAVVAARLDEWGVVRCLIAADPVLDELGVPDAVALAGAEALVWPGGRELGWRDLLGLDGPEHTCGVTAPALAVAERGTLVLPAGPGHGRAIDVVSERHLAVLPASRIRATLGEALAETYSGGRAPSAVSLVSGPSRTSDIEKIPTLGAHGALSLHVVVVSDR